MKKKVKYKGYGRQGRRLGALQRLEATLESGINHEGKELTERQKKRINREIEILKERLK